MPAMPKVSVIIPVYNVEQYIERCAISLFEQTLDDIEYIFVNDCTPDKSMEVLARVLDDYSARKDQVRIIDMPVNSGQAVATKIAISEAHGEYLIRCDADDSVDINMYRIMYEKCKSGEYDIVFCDKYYIKNDQRTIIKSFKHDYPDELYREKMIRNILDSHGIPSLCTAMAHRSLFDNELNYPKKRMGEDVALLIQLVYYASAVGYVNSPLYYYYYNSSSTCNALSETACYIKLADLNANFILMQEFLVKKGIINNYPKEIEVAKNKVRMRLGPILHSKETIREWMKIYPEIRWKILVNGHISLKEKKTIISKMIRYYLGI